ncbi:MAG: TonB-dependent receptor [Xanthomonadales bacterium]|nr:TonB-dependent receptor [Xanthomonadales bacterium]
MLNTFLLFSLLQLNTGAVNELNKVTVNTDSKTLAVMEVFSSRERINYSASSSLAVISAAELALESPIHPNEIFDRIPGVWISRGSGQEHLTAIRSPVLTGAGACGAFMVLEDQVPTRPAGFCNVNQLFEVNVAQAGRIDVLRGPGTVVYGSNALHGAISVFTPGPQANGGDEISSVFSLQLGGNSYYRGQVAMSSDTLAVQAGYTDAASFRDDERYRQGLFNFQALHSVGSASGRTSFAYTSLDQDTAGFILGKDAYKDSTLRRQNLNPDAFRKAWASRLSSRWNWQADNGDSIEFISYLRSSRMDFLQHFLPGTPLESNGQDSFGLLTSWSNERSLSAGIDLEWTQGFLQEFQENVLNGGSAFLNETRPQGYHYDYDVAATMAAVWFQWQHDFSSGLELTTGLRAEYLAYDYDNKMLDGNTRDDGSVCGFGGCLYTRPADRTDSFSNISPELKLSYQLPSEQLLYLRAARGYRAPQATELYRLQRGQLVADLKPVTLDSLEFGYKGSAENISYELIAYFMRKQNFIFRDANGFNVSDGKSRHRGVEAQFQWQMSAKLALNSNISWADNSYDFNRDLGFSGVISRGNEIDTAPPWLGALRLNWQPHENQRYEAEWVYQGGYFLDAANTFTYPGHALFNLRAVLTIADGSHQLSLRMNNVFDRRYAERADFAFGNYRYFPGRGRWLSLEWQYRH